MIDKDNLVDLGVGLLILSSICFVVSVIVAIVSKELRKKALIAMIICVVLAVVGFGTCLANISLGGMH